MANGENAWISLSGDLKDKIHCSWGTSTDYRNWPSSTFSQEPGVAPSHETRDSREDDRMSYLTRSRGKMLNFSSSERSRVTVCHPPWDFAEARDSL